MAFPNRNPPHSGDDTTAAIVSDDDDVLDFEDFDGVLDYGKTREVGMVDAVGNIAVDCGLKRNKEA